MKIEKINIYKFRLKFKEPVSVIDQKISHREGLLVGLFSDKGVAGFGEISPLPGLSRETLDQALVQVKELKSLLVGAVIPKTVHSMDGQLSGWWQELHLKPSVRCGMEMAVLNLAANNKKVGLNEFLSEDFHDHIKVHGLLQGNIEQVVSQARLLSRRGFLAMKLKVGGHLEEDIEKVQAVNEALGGQVLLHVDANRRWNFEQAMEFARHVSCAAIEYMEEPFADLSRIPEFFQETLIPVALDESLGSMTFDAVKAMDGVDYVVLKPMILGGMEKTWQMMREARKVALNAVISSSYESGVGILALANLAGDGNHHVSVGLDTLKYFENDLLVTPLTIERGVINIASKWVDPGALNLDALEMVDS